jgi:hypothetical protein
MEYEVIEKLNKSHVSVKRGDLMIPILKMNLFDNNKAMNLDYTIGALEGNVKESKTWKQWLQQNRRSFGITSAIIYTVKEYMNMLSVVLVIQSNIILGKKELAIV